MSKISTKDRGGINERRRRDAFIKVCDLTEIKVHFTTLIANLRAKLRFRLMKNQYRTTSLVELEVQQVSHGKDVYDFIRLKNFGRLDHDEDFQKYMENCASVVIDAKQIFVSGCDALYVAPSTAQYAQSDKL